MRKFGSIFDNQSPFMHSIFKTEQNIRNVLMYTSTFSDDVWTSLTSPLFLHEVKYFEIWPIRPLKHCSFKTKQRIQNTSANEVFIIYQIWFGSLPQLRELVATKLLPEKCAQSPSSRNVPHQKYIRDRVLGCYWNLDSDIPPTLP